MIEKKNGEKNMKISGRTPLEKDPSFRTNWLEKLGVITPALVILGIFINESFPGLIDKIM